MNGKTVLITGGTGGIGKQTAKALAKSGVQVVITGRDKGRGLAAVREIQAETQSKVELLLGDLGSMAGVRQLAQAYQAKYPRLDVLINNVGLLEGQKRLTPDGLEAHFAVNVVAPFLLTHALLPVLRKSTPARVINLTGGMPFGAIDFENMQAEKSFIGLPTYSHAKLLMSAMSLEFARRLQGTGISLNVAYPGAAGTAMTGGMTAEYLPPLMRLVWPIFKLVMRDDGGKSAAKAAKSSIYLASAPEVEGLSGGYYNTAARRIPPPASVADLENQRKIWQRLEQITGVSVFEPNKLVGK